MGKSTIAEVERLVGANKPENYLTLMKIRPLLFDLRNFSEQLGEQIPSDALSTEKLNIDYLDASKITQKIDAVNARLDAVESTVMSVKSSIENSILNMNNKLDNRIDDVLSQILKRLN